MLQFDGALTITHGSGIELPGAANLTTAAGDRLICYATAANTVEVMNVATEAAASSGGFTLGTEVATTSGTSFSFTGIPSGTTMIVLNFEDVSLGDGAAVDVVLGDSGGFETSGYVATSSDVTGGTALTTNHTSNFGIAGQAADEGFSGIAFLTLKDSSNFDWVFSYTGKKNTDQTAWGGGHKSLSAELTQVKIDGGTFDAGSLNIMYV